MSKKNKDTYILKISFSGFKRICYIRFNCEENTWDELFDPAYATEFSSKKEALKRANERTTMTEYISAIKKSDAEAEFNSWYDNGMVRRTLPIVNNALSRPYNGEDKYKILEWRWENQISNEDKVRFEDYRTWPDLHEV